MGRPRSKRQWLIVSLSLEIIRSIWQRHHSFTNQSWTRKSGQVQGGELSREAVLPPGLTVLGSTSFGDESKFYAMDFAGTYRLKQVGRMLVPLKKSHFGSRMEICGRS
ncbi:MAG: hypothetical protein J3R72DRAFT_181392 [Linnemannia gamsii]|nr:MAG: hypothetical protein J3R72DRAFT_181392 [Linnemannia gamsii]